MAARAEPDVERSSNGKFIHGCGQEFTHGGWYVKHAMDCDGVAPATSGRIAARNALVPVGGRPRLPVTDAKTERRRETYRKSARKKRGEDVGRTPPVLVPAPIIAAATDKAVEIVIAGLMAKRTAIDTAIAALQAVS